MRFLLHTGPEPVVDVIDGVKYEALPGKPLKFTDILHANAFLEHKHDYGVIEVGATETETGIQLDLAEAKERADQALKQAEDNIVAAYVKTQVEDRLRHNFPAMPPQGRAKEIIARKKIDLKKHGINPVGWLPEEQNMPGVASFNELKETNRLLQEQNQMLAGQNEKLAADLAKLTETVTALAATKTAPDTPAPEAKKGK